MQADEQGWCNSYYGIWHVRDEIKRHPGVHYFMIDEYVKKLIEKEKDSFSKEISRMMNNFNDSLKLLLAKNNEQINVIHSSIADLTKFMYKMIDLNKLKEPEIEKKETNKKVKVKQIDS